MEILRNKLGQFEKGIKINLGKHLSEESKIRMSKSKINNYKNMSEERKKYIISVLINNLKLSSLRRRGKHLSEEHKIKISLAKKGHKLKLSEEAIIKRSINALGSKNSHWKGGITPLNKFIRTNVKFIIWREEVFKRDNFTCQNPNCEYCNNRIGTFLHSHHIKQVAFYPELAFDINNGITYCKEFHINSGLHRNTLKEIENG